MTSQCPRCLSSFFPRLSNGRCTFCIGHFERQAPVAWPYNDHKRIVTRHYIEASVLNGRDRTTSGVIGQP